MRVALLIVASSTLGAAACGGEPASTAGFTDPQVIADFADRVVIPTYALLDARIDALHAATVALAATPTADNLDAAQQAWIAARVPWEQSEAFLFGPVSARGYDPALDSWPVERTDLDLVLASGDALTPAYVRNLPETQKGFHTLEYLLFGERRGRQVDELGERELAYLTATAAELADISGQLAASWTDGAPSFREVFVGAGTNSTYPSLDAAAQEILVGMSGICDEVANGKIADPYDAHDPALVESQYSWNSLADFADNLRSVEQAYLGDVPAAGTTGRGLDAIVAERDPALDARFRAELAAAIAAIGAIPPPFRDAITDPAAYPAIEAAQGAIRTVQATIDGELTTALR
ncbi:MAG: imelysin family protein [Kofleriaceae bacterium]